LIVCCPNPHQHPFYLVVYLPVLCWLLQMAV
jgi:hypothetical protein